MNKIFKLLLLFLSFVTTLNAKLVQDELSKQVAVQKVGTLESHFTLSEKQTVTNLTVSGPLDGSDIAFLRKMSGFKDEADQSGWSGGSLRVLDISSATIVKSKNAYLVSVPKEDGWASISWQENSYGGKFNFNRQSWNFDSMTKKDFVSFKRNVKTAKLGIRYEYINDNKIEAHYFCLKNVIGRHMFAECTSLQTIILPVSATKILKGAFVNCSQLSTIRIPHKIKEFDTDVFEGCVSLSRVEIPYDCKLALSVLYPRNAILSFFNPKKSDSATSADNVAPLAATDAAHEYVDLGLPSGTLWAKCNVGAAHEWQIGAYLAWGELSPKKKYSPETYFDLESILRSYPQDIIGTEYDAATHHWGEEWVMPTRAQANELYHECKWIWTDNYQSSGQSGCICMGPNGNTIFFPAGGVMMDGKLAYKGSGNIWTGDLDIFNHFEWAAFIDFNKNGPVAHRLVVNGTRLYASHDYRWWGRNVRPVRKK